MVPKRGRYCFYKYESSKNLTVNVQCKCVVILSTIK